MSDYMQDLGGVLGTHQVGNKTVTVTKKGSNMDLDMTDFITLMITQMTNQGIDQTMDTSEMLNQMIQMQMIQSMVNMTDASVTSYASSLVGKEVTVGKYDSDNKLQEIVGTVTASGTMNGEPVIFINDEYYRLSEIMAVGRLPEKKEEDDDKTDGVEKPGEGEKPGEAEKPDEGEKPGEVEKPDETEKPTEPENPSEPPEYNGENGAPSDTEG